MASCLCRDPANNLPSTRSHVLRRCIRFRTQHAFIYAHQLRAQAAAFTRLFIGWRAAVLNDGRRETRRERRRRRRPSPQARGQNRKRSELTLDATTTFRRRAFSCIQNRTCVVEGQRSPAGPSTVLSPPRKKQKLNKRMRARRVIVFRFQQVTTGDADLTVGRDARSGDECGWDFFFCVVVVLVNDGGAGSASRTRLDRQILQGTREAGTVAATNHSAFHRSCLLCLCLCV